MLALCGELDMASVCRSPLAMGRLTGKFEVDSRIAADDIRGSDPEWMCWFRKGRPVPEFLDRLAGIREILTGGGRTLAPGALAWIWARRDRSVPIVGVRTVAQVEENAGALAPGAAAAGPAGRDRHPARQVNRTPERCTRDYLASRAGTFSWPSLCGLTTM